MILKSTRDEIEEFKESMLWLDIQDELKDLSNRAQIEYDLIGEPIVNDEGVRTVPTTAEVLIHLGDVKGRRKAVGYFLNILDIFLQILEVEKDDSKRK